MSLKSNRVLRQRLKSQTRLEPSSATLADQAKKGNARREPRTAAHRDPVKADVLGNALYGLQLQKLPLDQHATTASTSFLATPSLIPGPSLALTGASLITTGPEISQLAPHSPLSAVEIAEQIFDQICRTEDAVQQEVVTANNDNDNNINTGIISFGDAAAVLEGPVGSQHQEPNVIKSAEPSAVEAFIEALEAPPPQPGHNDQAVATRFIEAVETAVEQHDQHHDEGTTSFVKGAEIMIFDDHNDEATAVSGVVEQQKPESEGEVPLSTPDVHTRTQYYHQRLQRALYSHDAHRANESTPMGEPPANSFGVLSPVI
jgi:hypothetical protein